MIGSRRLAGWNATESAAWNRLRLALWRLSDGALQYVDSVEPQKRGVLHRHIVLNVDRPLFPEEVQALAMQAGYGCVFDLEILQSAQKAAWYISKYVTKAAGARQDVPWLADVPDRQTGELRPMLTTATYRTWSASRKWGYTMKGMRELMRLQAQARARYLRELAAELATETGSLAPQTAGHVDTTGPPG